MNAAKTGAHNNVSQGSQEFQVHGIADPYCNTWQKKQERYSR